jgi:hypothetical protein
MTAMYGGFTSYIGSSEIIFGEVFDVGGSSRCVRRCWPLVMGAAMLLNSRIVVRVGSRRLSHAVLLVYIGASARAAADRRVDGGPPLWLFMVLMGGRAGQPRPDHPQPERARDGTHGAVAGMASSLIGTVQVAAGAGWARCWTRPSTGRSCRSPPGSWASARRPPARPGVAPPAMGREKGLLLDASKGAARPTKEGAPCGQRWRWP